MAGEVSFDVLFRTPTIVKFVQQIPTPLDMFQRWLRLSPGMPATDTVHGRHFGFDILDATRQIARGRAPGVGPGTTTRKQVGHVSGTVYRSHEKIRLLMEEIFKTRPLGQQIGNDLVDIRGQQHVQRQLKYLVQRFRNSRENMVSRMLRGQCDLKFDVDDIRPIDTGGDLTVDFQIPDDNKTQLYLGTGSDIIDATWLAAGTDIIGHVLAINKAFTRLTGRALKHIWCNSTLYNSLLANTGLQTVTGSAYRVFEFLTGREVQNREGIPDSGFDVVFGAIPLVTFHVYDGVLCDPSLEGVNDETTVANTNLLIPDVNAIFTPEPDTDWVGWVEGSEWVSENIMDSGREVFGFHSWASRVIDPPGMELTEPDDLDFYIHGRIEGRPDCHHRSTVWPLYRDRLLRCRREYINYGQSENYYIHGPQGFSD